MQQANAKFWRNGFFKQIFGCSCCVLCISEPAGLFKSSWVQVTSNQWHVGVEHTKQDEAYESTFTCLDFKSRFVYFRPILLDFHQRILNNILLFIILENIGRFSTRFVISFLTGFSDFQFFLHWILINFPYWITTILLEFLALFEAEFLKSKI